MGGVWGATNDGSSRIGTNGQLSTAALSRLDARLSWDHQPLAAGRRPSGASAIRESNMGLSPSRSRVFGVWLVFVFRLTIGVMTIIVSTDGLDDEIVDSIHAAAPPPICRACDLEMHRSEVRVVRRVVARVGAPSPPPLVLPTWRCGGCGQRQPRITA